MSQETRALWPELKGVFITLLVCIGALWTAEIVDVAAFQGGLDRWGIAPREVAGLLGVLTGPLLHGSFEHLISNTVGIVVLGGLVAMVGRREFLVVSLVGWVVAGMGTWAVGRPAIHIGASGVVFAYFGYLLLRGWYDRKFASLALSVVLMWGYGSVLWGMIPGFAPVSVSWEAHLFGFLGGVLAAKLLHRRRTEAV